MKTLFTLLLTCMISLNLMGQNDVQKLRKERYEKKHPSSTTALVKKKSRNPEYASRHLSRRASDFRRTALKAVKATDQKMDSTHWELYDAQQANWELSDRQLYTYDGLGNMTVYVWFAYDSVEMKILPYDKETVKHNERGQPTEIIWLIWDKSNNQWVNWGKYELEYDAEGNLLQETVSDWDFDAGQWLEGAKYEMSYDGNGELVEEIWSFWDEDSAKLVLNYKAEYVYVDGKLTTWNQYLMEGGKWVELFQTTYTYDPQGNLTFELTLYYDPVEDMWMDDSQIIYTYNEANQLTMEEAWEFNEIYSTLIQSWQSEYTWDSDGNLIEQVDRSWSLGARKGANEWLDAFKSEWTFNKEFTLFDLYVPYWFLQEAEDVNFVHMPVSELGYVYVDGAWVMDYRQTAYYSAFDSSTGTDDIQENKVSIYPIPASEMITFSWEDPYMHLSLELYDLTGKRVISRSIDKQETIDVNHLSGGIYLYKLMYNNDLIHSGKISVE